MRRSITRRTLCAGLAVGLLLDPSFAQAAELTIVSSGGFAAAYRALAPAFEKQSGDTLKAEWGPSMGTTPNAVPQRLARGEPIDVVIMVGYALGDLVKKGEVLPDSRVDLARPLIGAAVRQGAPHPDISTVDGLKTALLAARSVAYSDSASGVYIEKELFKRLGIEKEMAGKSQMIPATPVGEIVARGEADLGFQQLSELKPVHGIDILGPIPDEVQSVTVFSAGIVARSQHRDAAASLIKFLASSTAAPAVRDSGLEPIAHP